MTISIAKLEDLVGKTLSQLDGNHESTVFITTNGDVYKLKHDKFTRTRTMQELLPRIRTIFKGTITMAEQIQLKSSRRVILSFATAKGSLSMGFDSIDDSMNQMVFYQEFDKNGRSH